MGNLLASHGREGTIGQGQQDAAFNVPLSVLLDAPLGQVDWDQVRGVLEQQEEQCAAYAFGYDPSPLCRAVEKQCPIDVLMQMVDAYPEALDQIHPQTGDTVLHAAVRKVYPEQQQQQQHVGDPVARLARHDDANTEADEVTDDEALIDDPDYVARIEYLLQQRPLLAQTWNERKGWLPSHEPKIGHSNVIDLLYKYNPSCITSTISKNGRLPLHQVLSLSILQQGPGQRHKPSIATVRRLVKLSANEAPSLSNRSKRRKLGLGGILVRDKRGHSPLELLCCHITSHATSNATEERETPAEDHSTTAVNDGSSSDKSSTSTMRGCLSRYGLKLWKYVLLEWIRMIMTKQQQHGRTQLSSSTSERHHDQQNDHSYELHTLIELGCLMSRPLILQAVRHDLTHQTLLRNKQGKTPLHIAAASTQRVIQREDQFHSHQQDQQVDDDNTFPISTTPGATTIEDFLISTLIEQNPQAPRMTDFEGRLPIDYAAECGKTCIQGLARLIQSEPRAVDTRDLRDHNYPFISAALSNGDNVGSSSSPTASSSSPPSYTTNSLSATYFLLRAKPHVLSYYHTP